MTRQEASWSRNEDRQGVARNDTAIPAVSFLKRFLESFLVGELAESKVTKLLSDWLCRDRLRAETRIFAENCMLRDHSPFSGYLETVSGAEGNLGRKLQILTATFGHSFSDSGGPARHRILAPSSLQACPLSATREHTIRPLQRKGVWTPPPKTHL